MSLTHLFNFYFIFVALNYKKAAVYHASNLPHPVLLNYENNLNLFGVWSLSTFLKYPLIVVPTGISCFKVQLTFLSKGLDYIP